MNKLNVLFLNSWYPNKVNPQNGNFIYEHAKSVSLYSNVICLSVQSISQEREFNLEVNNAKNIIEIVVYYKKIKSTNIFNLFLKKRQRHRAFLLGLNEVNKYFKKIDITHLNVMFPAGLFALYLKKKQKIPYIITEHSTLFINKNLSKFSFIEWYYIKKIAAKASRICPVSELLKKEMILKKIRGEFTVIPNVVNSSLFKFKPKKEGTNTILHVSSLKNNHKNFKGIFRVIKKLSSIRTDFVLKIISSSDFTEAKKYAAKINLNNERISFHNNKSAKDIVAEMQMAKLFLLFSNYETFSLVVPEALLCGTPVISTNVGVVSELITPENGLLVEIGNESDLLNKLIYMLDHINNFNNKEISKKIIDKYSYERVGKQFSKLYYDVLLKT